MLGKRNKNSNVMMMISERASSVTIQTRATNNKVRTFALNTKHSGTQLDESDKQTIENMNGTGQLVSFYRIWLEPAVDTIQAQGETCRQELLNDITTIGRWSSSNEENADVTIEEDPPYTISRQHCKVAIQNNKVVLTDNNSRYGTIVNKKGIGKVFGAPDSIELTQGKHFITLGPQKCGNHFYVTVKQYVS